MGDWFATTAAQLASPWAYVLVAVLVGAESVLLGFVPLSGLALLLGGFLAATESVSLLGVLAVAVLAAVVGDVAGYELGRWFGVDSRTSWLGRRVGAARLIRAESTSDSPTRPSVRCGWLFSVSRVLWPVAAGIVRKPRLTFLRYALVDGVSRAIALVVVGFLVSWVYQWVAVVAGSAGIVLVLLLGLGAVVVGVARWISTHRDQIRRVLTRQLDRPVVWALRCRYRRELAFLARRLTPGGALGLWLTLGLVVIIACGSLFGGITEDVIGREELATEDSPIAAWLARHRVDWLTTDMHVLTTFGSAWITVPLTVGAALTFSLREYRWRALILGLVVAVGASLLSNSIKLVIGRPRPDLATLLVEVSSFAFPSGHATQAAATYLAIAYLASARLARWSYKVMVWTACVLVVMLVGFSRLYLGAHWLTDVLGGYALGTAWVATVLTTASTVYRLRTHRRSADSAARTP